MTIIYSTNTLVSKNEGSGKHPRICHFATLSCLSSLVQPHLGLAQEQLSDTLCGVRVDPPALALLLKHLQLVTDVFDVRPARRVLVEHLRNELAKARVKCIGQSQLWR